jgi:hypothetical protein
VYQVPPHCNPCTDQSRNDGLVISCNPYP